MQAWPLLNKSRAGESKLTSLECPNENEVQANVFFEERCCVYLQISEIMQSGFEYFRRFLRRLYRRY